MKIPKNLLQKLSIIKNNSALLLPIAIGLVSVLVFIPTQLMSSKLKAQVENESIAKRGKQVKALSESAVSKEQYKEEAKHQMAYANDANQIALLAIQSTHRQIIRVEPNDFNGVYDIFPKPTSESQFIFEGFGQRYCQTVDALITRINARDCPTETELKTALESAPARSRSGPRLSSLVPRASSFGAWDEVKATIVEELCRERAESASVYANPTNLSGYEYWRRYKYSTGMQRATEDCWYYQLAYWVIEDVIDTIDKMNTGSNSVFTSPVKRLITVNFNMGQMQRRRIGSGYAGRMMLRTGTTTETDDKPIYIVTPRNAMIEPCTGRYCNEDIDVIHFNTVVVLNAKTVMPFMQELCSAKEHKFAGYSGNEPQQTFKHNQITILESKIRPIDPEDKNHALYRYGEDAVVELDLICEYILNKKGYDQIKPDSVKEAIKAEAEKKKP